MMLDPEKILAFMLVTATTSLVPGQSMLFVMGQAIWHGHRTGWVALAGMQLGYIVWWVLAGLGLGTLARHYPLGFQGLAILGLAYLAWMGAQAIKRSFNEPDEQRQEARKGSGHAFRDGILIAIGNPKSLIYMVALIPPFIDVARPIAWQITTMALIALIIDIAIGALYIGMGRRLAGAMQRTSTRRWLDRGVGIAFLAIAAVILLDLLATPV